MDGEIESYNIVLGRTYLSTHDGIMESDVGCDIETTSASYRLAIKICLTNERDRRSEEIQSLYMVEASKIAPDVGYWGSIEWPPGLHFPKSHVLIWEAAFRMDFFLNFCIGFLFLCLSFVFCFIMHYVDGHSIVEVGYRSQQMYKKVLRRTKGQPYWDYLSYWSLCKNAKKNQKAVLIFFAIHLIPLFASLVAVIVWPVMLFFNPNAMFRVQLGFVWVVFFIHTGIHMVIDDKYLPSERKRRRLFRFSKDTSPE